MNYLETRPTVTVVERHDWILHIRNEFFRSSILAGREQTSAQGPKSIKQQLTELAWTNGTNSCDFIIDVFVGIANTYDRNQLLQYAEEISDTVVDYLVDMFHGEAEYDINKQYVNELRRLVYELCRCYAQEATGTIKRWINGHMSVVEVDV